MNWIRTSALASFLRYSDLVVLYVIAVASAVGFGVFRAWPELLAQSPGAMAAYPQVFKWLSRGQILFAFLALAFFLVRHTRWRWLAAFLVVYLVSLGSELLGTTAGVPFGAYSYTPALGPMWFDHVPMLIPLSWFMMALPSYVLAQGQSTARRIVVASLILLAWDLALDPAMSGATAFWVWGETGPYYGMPWLNLLGWFVTGLALMSVLALLRAERWADALPRGWIIAYYGANLALPVGLAAVSGMWLAIGATAAALAACWLLARPRPAFERAVA